MTKKVATPGTSSNGNGASAPDPATSKILDLAAFALPQAFADQIGVQREILRLPVKKPERQWFVRCHPDVEHYWFEAATLEVREEKGEQTRGAGDFYLVSPNLLLQPEISKEVRPSTLVLSMTRGSNPFVWPLMLPGRRESTWHLSAREAAERAREKWVSVRANQEVGAYDVLVASAKIPDPIWPTKSFAELLTVAFRDRIIDTADHEVLLRLQGEK